MDAKISNKCISQIYEAVEKCQQYEIGGILLGIKTSIGIIALKAVVIPSMDECTYSYSLDGKAATEIANSSYYDFVGIWHSHINSYEHFSSMDEKVNQDFAEMFDGIISILAVVNQESIHVSAFLIDETGKSTECL